MGKSQSIWVLWDDRSLSNEEIYNQVGVNLGTDYSKAFDCVDHNKLWKILQKMEITRPPYLPPEKPVCRSRSNYLELNMEQQTDSQTGKGVHQGSILSPCLFNLYAEYIM